MSMRLYGQHPITEQILGIVVAIVTIASISLGFLVGLKDFPRYLHLRSK